jgi:hypothetical protein
MKKGIVLAFLCCLLVLHSPAQVISSSVDKPGAFPLIRNRQSPAILLDANDASVVKIAAKALVSDIEIVSEKKQELITYAEKYHFQIIAGTIGQSVYIDQLVKTNKLQVKDITGKWESFLITTINNPMPGVKQALVIAGSDRRGTAYGIFEISRALGVSPWVWWADAVPAKQNNIFILPGIFISKEPSVKYRGIFLNDEDWGLQPWAAKTVEPETGDIGPKTYSKIFELLLRLRANMIWPAMHDCTKAFFTIPGNAKVAADYAILIGSSHAEPMLRNNVGEWKEKTMGPFNYISNRDSVLKYWEDRVKESQGINAMYSMGMRGVHDSKMEGVNDVKEAVPLLEKIISDQRELLTRYINKDIKSVPQVFTAYKEVLDIYDNGLNLQEDITLVWPDDNYGYIQRLNNTEESKRSGGSGVYYHASYWGRPHDYLWISSTHPALIQEEMMKAYDNGSKTLWVLNVGDIKPLEYNIELFLDMGYNAVPFKHRGFARQHLLNWSAGLFGKNNAAKIQPILWDYYRLGFQRRPEFMGWSQTEPTTKTNFTQFNHFYYGDEAQKRIDQYQQLEDKVNSVRENIPTKDQAAFYQLVYYPVRGASLMNKKFIYRDKSYYYSLQNRQSAVDYAQLSKAAYDSIIRETDYFNNQLSGAKWKNMLSMKPRNLPVFLEPDIPPIKIDETNGWGIAPEGWVNKDSSLLNYKEGYQLPGFDPKNRQEYFIDLFICNLQAIDWVATVSAPWIKLSQLKGHISSEPGHKQTRIRVSVDWSKAPVTTLSTGSIRFTGAGKEYTVSVKANHLNSKGVRGNTENNGYVSIQASHYSWIKSQYASTWEKEPGIGYNGEALRSGWRNVADPEKMKDSSWIISNCTVAEYDFYTFTAASASLSVFSIPSHPLNNRFSMRYAVSVDNGPLQVVDFRTFGRSEEWKQNVLRNRAERKINLSYLDKGPHRLRVYALDPGVLLDALLIDLGGLKKNYGVIQETK